MMQWHHVALFGKKKYPLLCILQIRGKKFLVNFSFPYCAFCRLGEDFSYLLSFQEPMNMVTLFFKHKWPDAPMFFKDDNLLY